jgi:UDP-glucose 4-epimerase
MKLLVTGGSGFIGSHIVKEARDKGWTVAVLDVALARGCDRFFRADIRNRADVAEVVRAFKPDVVSHHAALVSVPDSFVDPYHDAETNVINSLSLLEACADNGVKRFVFASSAGAVYGEVPHPLLANELTTPNPSSPYGVNKLAFESMLRIHAKRTGMHATVLRYSNVYGPGQVSGVVPAFLAARRAKRDLKVFGDCVRDYVHVSDVVKANMSAMAGLLPADIMNVSTGIGTTTSQLASMFGKFRLASGREGDVYRSVVGSVYQPAGHGSHWNKISLTNGIRDLTVRSELGKVYG